MSAAVGPNVQLEPGHHLGDGANIGAGCRIAGHVFGTVGPKSTVRAGASVRGTVGSSCTIGVEANIGDGATLGDVVWVGSFAVIQPRVSVGAKVVVPDHATVTTDMSPTRRGDLVVVGMVGSEGYGRWVTVGRQADMKARLIVGCWKEHKGGSANELETRIWSSPKRWEAGAGGDAGQALFSAQYRAVVFLARQLEAVWADYAAEGNVAA